MTKSVRKLAVFVLIFCLACVVSSGVSLVLSLKSGNSEAFRMSALGFAKSVMTFTLVFIVYCKASNKKFFRSSKE